MKAAKLLINGRWSRGEIGTGGDVYGGVIVVELAKKSDVAAKISFRQESWLLSVISVDGKVAAMA